MPDKIDSLKEFHRQIMDDKYQFLKDITIVNGGQALVYGYVLDFQIDKLLRNQIDDLQLIVYIYHHDSGAVGIEAIKIGPKHMKDFNLMKAEISKCIMSAFKEAMDNQGMIIEPPRADGKAVDRKQ
jgi:hypothetical protein